MLATSSKAVVCLVNSVGYFQQLSFVWSIVLATFGKVACRLSGELRWLLLVRLSFVCRIALATSSKAVVCLVNSVGYF